MQYYVCLYVILRLILKDGTVEVHRSVEDKAYCVNRKCGTLELGIDEGYTEVFTDSRGERHGQGLGKMLSAESDYLKQKIPLCCLASRKINSICNRIR